MKLTHFIFILILFVFLLGCKARMDVEVEKSNPLAGTTWELTSGKWSSEDTTFTFPNSTYDRMVVIYGKTHYAVVGQDTSRKSSHFGVGTYSIDDDNLTFTSEMCRSYEEIGKSINLKFQIESDQFILKAKDYRYLGYEWKELHEVYKRID